MQYQLIGMNMHKSVMQAWTASSHLAGANAGYLEQMYETFLDDPSAVPDAWRAYFQQLTQELPTAQPEQPHTPIRDRFRSLAMAGRAQHLPTEVRVDTRQIQVLHLINSYRVGGHQDANLDPLGLWSHEPVPELGLGYYDLGVITSYSIHYTKLYELEVGSPGIGHCGRVV